MNLKKNNKKTVNPSAFWRWMVSGPEQACLLKEFENQLSGYCDEQNLHHHEQSVSVQEFPRNMCVICIVPSILWKTPSWMITQIC